MGNIVTVNISDLKVGNRTVIKSAQLNARQGEFIAITGESGSGKSTLINAISNLTENYKGEIKVLGKDITTLSSKEHRYLLRKKLSYIMQDNGLVLNETVKKNLLYIPRVRKNYNQKKIIQVFKILNLNPSLIDSKVMNLSGGEMQRVAIAKSILKKSSIIICDEPTGNLDQKNAAIIFKIFRRLANNGITIIMVTHDDSIRTYVDTIYRIQDKKLIKE